MTTYYNMQGLPMYYSPVMDGPVPYFQQQSFYPFQHQPPFYGAMPFHLFQPFQHQPPFYGPTAMPSPLPIPYAPRDRGRPRRQGRGRRGAAQSPEPGALHGACDSPGWKLQEPGWAVLSLPACL